MHTATRNCTKIRDFVFLLPSILHLKKYQYIKYFVILAYKRLRKIETQIIIPFKNQISHSWISILKKRFQSKKHVKSSVINSMLYYSSQDYVSSVFHESKKKKPDKSESVELIYIPDSRFDEHQRQKKNSTSSVDGVENVERGLIARKLTDSLVERPQYRFPEDVIKM